MSLSQAVQTLHFVLAHISAAGCVRHSPKVTDFDLSTFADKNVLGLEVAVEYTVAMEIVQRTDKLRGDQSDLNNYKHTIKKLEMNWKLPSRAVQNILAKWFINQESW